MARYLGPKHKLCRRSGIRLCGLAKCPLDRRGAVPPGQHGFTHKRESGEFGIQLREKQKAKWIYAIPERQFRNYFQKAFRQKGATGEFILQLLESRLDNIIYRLGFAPSRSAARQLVRHGFVLVDDRPVNIPSYQVKPGQTVNLKPRILKIEPFKKLISEKKVNVPSWLQRKAIAGKMMRLPKREEIEADINEQLVVEYYSKQR